MTLSGESLDIVNESLQSVLADLSCVTFRREMDAHGRVTYPWVGPNARKLLGVSAEGLSAAPQGNLYIAHWADRDAQAKAIQQSAQDLSVCRENFRIVTPMGETRWLRGTSLPRRQGDIIIWEGAWLDISPWMRAEQHFQTVMDHAQDAIIMFDAKRCITWINAATEEMFGASLNMMTGKCISQCFEGDDFGADGYLSSGGTRELMARRSDGLTFPFEATLSELRSDGNLSFILIGRDITQRKITETMLQESEQRLASIAANLPGVVFQRVIGNDQNFGYSYLSQGISEISGYQPHEIIEDPNKLLDAIVPEDRQRLISDLHASMHSLEALDEDFRIRDRQGNLRWLSGQSRPRMSQSGEIVWDGIAIDVTAEVEERTRAEQAIAESESRFQMAFTSTSVGIVMAEHSGVISRANPAFLALCGVSDIKLDGLNIFDLIDRTALPDWDLAPMGTLGGIEYSPNFADDRERFWRINMTKYATGVEQHYHMLLVIEDVTEASLAALDRHNMEQALTRAQKMEALGRLAGGVAHELNNMLGPILMAAELMDKYGHLDSQNLQRCQRIIEAAKHGRDIVRNVLTFSRKDSNVLGQIDLVPMFNQFAGLVTSALPPTIDFDLKTEIDQALVMGDTGQMTQILLNLVNNARDAMESRGKLGVYLSVIGPGEHLKPRLRRDGNFGTLGQSFNNPFAKLDPSKSHVMIRVSDTGSGMSQETLMKVFDPFFTTKEVGQGTGLGLSVVQGLVKAMNGAIAVDTAPGHGTAFEILIPLCEATLPANE